MNVEAKFRDDLPAERSLAPVVAMPSGGLPGLVIALIGLILAVALFLFLNARRTETESLPQQNEGLSGVSFTPPPPLVVPQTAPARPQIYMVPPPPAAPAIVQRPLVYAPPMSAQSQPYVVPPPPTPQDYGQSYVSPPEQPVSPPAARPSLSEPALLGALGEASAFTQETQGAAAASGDKSGGSQVAEAQSVRAARLGNLSTTVVTGTLIPAVLETPIDTSRPGSVRAIVSRDARGFDGSRVLIPRGSKLVGECRGDVRSGQKRVLVTWTRLIRPDGVTIRLDSPAADSLGGPGVPGVAHSYFFERFIGGAFQSAIGVGEALLRARTSNTVVIGVPGADGNVTQVIGAPTGPQPKITVAAGALINVFVAHDLDFSSPPSGR